MSNYILRFLTVLIIVLVGNYATSQIDSVDVQVTSQTISDPEILYLSKQLNVTIEVDDISDLGEIAIVVIDDLKSRIIFEKKYSKDFLNQNNHIVNNVISIQLDVQEISNYRIETLVKTQAGAHKPVVVTNHNI